MGGNDLPVNNLPELRFVEQGDFVPLAEVTELAYAGSPEGSGISCRAKDSTLRMAVLLRPAVPMRQLVAVGPVAALAGLAALESLGADSQSIGIAWPNDLVVVPEVRPHAESAPYPLLAKLSTKAGYAEGTFVVLGVDVDLAALACLHFEYREQQGGSVGSNELHQRLAQALQKYLVAGVRRWEASVEAWGAQAGPWAPFLQEYFDRVPLLGQPVNVSYPNGRLYARGVFVGIDIWGRATVRTRRAGDIEFPAEKFRIGPQSL